MKKHIVYKTEGVCASKIEFDLEDGRVYHVQFHGGCKGNVQGIARLADGSTAIIITLVRISLPWRWKRHFRYSFC